MKQKSKEEQIYDEIINLRKGNSDDQKVAFECMGILGNECTIESFESRLDIVEKKILKQREKSK